MILNESICQNLLSSLFSFKTKGLVLIQIIPAPWVYKKATSLYEHKKEHFFFQCHLYMSWRWGKRVENWLFFSLCLVVVTLMIIFACHLHISLSVCLLLFQTEAPFGKMETEWQWVYVRWLCNNTNKRGEKPYFLGWVFRWHLDAAWFSCFHM